MTFWLIAIAVVAVLWPVVLTWVLQQEVNSGFEHYNRKILSTGADADMQILRLRRRLAVIEQIAGQEGEDFDAFRDQILNLASQKGDAYLFVPPGKAKTGAISDFEKDFLLASFQMRQRFGNRFPYSIF